MFYVTYKTLVSSEMRFDSPRDSQAAHRERRPRFMRSCASPTAYCARRHMRPTPWLGALSQTCANLLRAASAGTLLATARGYSSDSMRARRDRAAASRDGPGSCDAARNLSAPPARMASLLRSGGVRLGRRRWPVGYGCLVGRRWPQVSYDEARTTILAAVARSATTTWRHCGVVSTRSAG